VALAFQKAAGVKLNHIPFAGGGPSVTALLAATSMWSPFPLRRHFAGASGKIEDPCSLCRQETGDVSRRSYSERTGGKLRNGHVARRGCPKGTPPDALKKLHDAFKKGMEDPAFKKSAADMAVTIHYLDPEAFES